MKYSLSLQGFEKHGDRRAVYEALVSSLASAGKYSAPSYLLCALTVAGFGQFADDTLEHYWPAADRRPLFTDAREYLPRILKIAAQSPHERFRAAAVNAIPLVSRAEFLEWGFDDTTMPLPQRTMIAARLKEPELFDAMVGDLAQRAQEGLRSSFIFSPPLTLDYMVGPEGPFIFYPCGGKGEGSQRITVEQLYEALGVPFYILWEEQSRRFKAIIGDVTNDRRDLRFPCSAT